MHFVFFSPSQYIDIPFPVLQLGGWLARVDIAEWPPVFRRPHDNGRGIGKAQVQIARDYVPAFSPIFSCDDAIVKVSTQLPTITQQAWCRADKPPEKLPSQTVHHPRPCLGLASRIGHRTSSRQCGDAGQGHLLHQCSIKSRLESTVGLPCGIQATLATTFGTVNKTFCSSVDHKEEYSGQRPVSVHHPLPSASPTLPHALFSLSHSWELDNVSHPSKTCRISLFAFWRFALPTPHQPSPLSYTLSSCT